MKSKLTTLSALFIILLGLSLIFWQPVNNYIISPFVIDRAQSEVMEQNYEDYLTNYEAAQQLIDTSEDTFNYDSVESLDSLSVSVDIDHEKAVGEIIVPSVDIHLPILIGTNNETLKAGIGTMKPEQEMGEGNYALAGHNSANPKQLFAPIRNIEEGEEIILTDKQHVYIYEKVSSERVMPQETNVIEDVKGKELVTLVSCYLDDGSDRIIVQGELKEVLMYDEVENQ